MRHGTRPVWVNHRDFDFIKSHRLGSVTVSDANFADEFFADANLTMPNQGIEDTEFVPSTPPMLEGCTNFAQADITTDLTGILHNPNDLEAVTHANANGGCEMQVSLSAAKGLGWFKQYFNIKTSGALDAFDSFRLAQVTGVDVGEKRSITWCTPWFPSWEKAALTGQSVMPMPTIEELQSANSLPWHDSKLDGWGSNLLVAPGRLLYRDKSWQGNQIGDKGFLYFPREVVNMVMRIAGTAGFTPTNKPVSNPQTINISALEWILSVLRNILADIRG